MNYFVEGLQGSGKSNITKYLLFSLSGFTDWFNDIDKTNLVLITVDDMYK